MKVIIKLKDDSWHFGQSLTITKSTMKAALKEVSKQIYISQIQLKTLEREGFVKIPGITIWRVIWRF